MANTKITADNLAANAVTSASIADNSIGITQLNVSDGTNGQVLTTNGSGTLSFSTISGYTDSDVETYLNTSEIYTDATNNRLGIGIASPSEKLEVAGNIFVNTSGNPTITNKTTGAGNNPVFRLQADTNYWDLQGTFSNANDELFFMYNASTKMAITSSGNVGIGQTSPETILHIGDGTSNFVRIENAASGDIASGYQIYRGASLGMNLYDNPADNTTSLQVAGSFTINAGGAGSDLYVSSSGSVGIGTTGPSSSYKLDIAGKQRIVNNADPFALTLERTAATTGSFGLGVDGDGAYRLSSASQVHQQIDDQGISYYRAYTDMVFFTSSSSTERMRINSSGGVSVSNDGQMGYSGSKFHVKGTAFTTSDSSGNNTGGFSTFSGYKSVSSSATTIFTVDRTNGAHSGFIIITKSESGDSASAVYSWASNYGQTPDLDLLSSATTGYTGFTLSASQNNATTTFQLTHGASPYSNNYSYTVLYGGSAKSTTPTLY